MSVQIVVLPYHQGDLCLGIRHSICLFSLMDRTIGSKNFNDMRDDYWQRRNEDYRRHRKVQSLTVDQGLPL